MKAKIWNFKAWIETTDAETLKSTFDELLDLAEFKVLNIQEHYFEPYGYTRLYLLGESHFALHTFPEHCKTYIELSSCNLKKYKRFKRELKVWMKKR